MTVYVVAQLTITDRAAYRKYQEAFPAILARFGGTLLAADDHARTVEGTWPYDRIVLIEFTGRRDLDAWAAPATTSASPPTGGPDPLGRQTSRGVAWRLPPWAPRLAPGMSLALLMDGGSSRVRAGPRVILDWLGVSVATEEGTAEYPAATGAGMRPAAAYAATLARREPPPLR